MQKRIEGLELARFVFAFAVLLYHYLWYGPLTGHAPLVPTGPGWLIFGRFAVEAFFVISGYVIALSTEGRTATRFLIARTARLWPALAICACLTFLVTREGLFPLAKALLFAPMLLGGGQVDPSYWSIVIEMRFYLGVFLLLLIWRRLPNPDILCVAWLAASAAALFAPALAAWVLSPYSAFFIFGLLLYSHEKGSRFALWIALPTLALAAAQVWLDFERVDMFDGVRSPWWTGLIVAALIFVATFAMRRGLPAALSGVAITVGAMTYPLYLIHQLVGYAIINTLAPMTGWIAAVCATIATTLCVAYAISRFIEPPAKRALTRLLVKLDEVGQRARLAIFRSARNEA